jgi:Fe-S cluster assembly ATP-binding protein
MLQIENLHVAVQGATVLRGVNLTLKAGEVHVIMGPNGSGKSTLVHTLAGKEGYEVIQGRILFQGQDIQSLSVTDRALLGIFLGMQYPVELPGVNNAFFLRMIYNKKRQREGLPPIDAMDFLSLLKEKMAILAMDQSFIKRNVNEGFSGGEKKRNEVLQMLLLAPPLVVLDELDSGLDIDALAWVAKGVNALRDQGRSFLIVTHYQRLLNHIVPDFVHVLAKGEIIKTGDRHLALTLEEKGYGWLGVADEA